MKIAQVSPYDWVYPGGVTTHVAGLAKEFIRMGHQITILAPSSRKPAELPGGNLVVLGRPIPVPMSGSIARVSISLHLAPQVKALLEAERFDVVHIHEPLLPVLPLTVLRYSRSLNVGTFHAYARSLRGYRPLRSLLMRWFRRLHGKIAVSQPAAYYIGRYFPGYYNVIPNGIDLSHFGVPAQPIERFSDGKVNILFVGRMEKRKGLPYLLSAFARIKWEHPQVRLLVVGPGKLDAVSERILAERALKDVELIGSVSYGDLPRYYRTADIFCSPALGSESFGIVLLEAMAAARPIVASNIAGYASLIRHGVQGLLVEPKNDKALAASLTQLITNPRLREELGQRGRAHAQEFSWQRVASQVMDYYVGLLEERNSRGLLRGSV